MIIAIPTYGRLSAQKTLAAIPDKLRPRVALVVRPCEATAANALGVAVWVLQRSATTISATRQGVGRLAERHGHKHFFMLDDDLKFYQRDAGKLVPLVDWAGMVKRVEFLLQSYRSVSISERFGNTFCAQSTRELARQTQATAYITEIYNSLPFGGSEYFEDAERTLQLFTRGHKNVKLFDYAVEAGRMNTPGGCSTFRNYEGMNADARSMATRWPGVVTYKQKPDKTFFVDGSPRPDINVRWRAAYRGA